MYTDLQLCDLCHSLYDNDSPLMRPLIAGVDIGYLVSNDCAVVAFEGSHDFLDWIKDFQAVMVNATFAGVEQGFYSGLDKVGDYIFPLLDKNKPVYVTGHSLGAARALIFTAMLIIRGYKVEACVFASPHPGNKALGDILAQHPVRSYRNFHDNMNQDFVCTLPAPLHFIAPYVAPGQQILIDEAPSPDDAWNIFARHHLFLYRRAIAAKALDAIDTH